MYTMIGTRPHLVYVIGELSKYVSKPFKQHVIAAKRVLHCLQFTKDFHLKHTRGNREDAMLTGDVKKMVLASVD